jgi:hypothetical protein
VLALTVGILPAQAAPPFDRGDLNRELAYTALHLVDWGQTLNIARNPDRFHERNPILGRHPSPGQVNRYMAASLAAHWLIARALKPKARKIFQGVTLVIKSGFVAGNYSVGLRVDF